MEIDMSDPTRRPHTRARTAAFLAGTVLVLGPAFAGCGPSGSAGEPSAKQTAANGDVFNDADVSFAQWMIPHHAQAIEMADLTRGRELSPAVVALAERILTAQAPEIEAMTGWLTAWNEEVPETSRDHANAHDDSQMEDMSDEIPGMMSPDDMAVLEAAPDSEFEDMWLTMMAEHHDGAIEMARTEQETGEFGEAVTLAEDIESGQTAEVTQIESLLGS
jgi:uncharacterized protein (DUF305 family)